MRAPDELLRLVEDYLAGLMLSPDLGAQRESMLYALEGGKRIRAVICLGTAEAAGGDVDAALPAAAALELVHAFSLVHDDLPAMDDDDERRGRPSAHAAFGEGVALLAGDGLLVEAFRLALTYSSTGVARELADATLGMIGGQYLDITGADSDLEQLHRVVGNGCRLRDVGGRVPDDEKQQAQKQQGRNNKIDQKGQQDQVDTNGQQDKGAGPQLLADGENKIPGAGDGYQRGAP